MIRGVVEFIRRWSLSITSTLLLVSLAMLVLSLCVAIPRQFKDMRQDALRAAVGDVQGAVARLDLSLARFHDVLQLFSDEADTILRESGGEMVLSKLFEVNYHANVRSDQDIVSFYGYIKGRFFSPAVHTNNQVWVPPQGYDPTSRPWYHAAIAAKGKVGCSDPYVDLETGLKVFSFAKLLSDGESVIVLDVRMSGVFDELIRRRNVHYGHGVVFSSCGEILVTDCQDPADGLAFEGFCRRVVWPSIAADDGVETFSAAGKSGKKVRVFVRRSRFGLPVAVIFKEEEFRAAYARPMRPSYVFAAVCGFLFVVVASVGYLRLRKLNHDLKARNRELIRAQKAKSTFFSMVSHDLRTPLNSIVGFADILRFGVDTREEELEAVQAIYDGSQAMLRMVSDLLDVARLDHGGLSVTPAECDIAGVVAVVKRMLDVRRHDDRSPILVTSVDPMPSVMFDFNRLRQILSNLVDNAFKFSPAGSEVALRVRWRQDSAAAETGQLTIEVEDHGQGIPEAAQAKIFEPFEQACDNNHRGAGVGLGLTICKSLTELMGGKIALRSTVGVGTVFTLDFPNVRKVGEIPSEPQPEAVAEKPVKNAVLIVDDLSANLKVLAVTLKRLGETNVVEAEDGIEALELLDAAPDGAFKCVLTDLWMPRLDGYGLLQEIRRRPRFADLPVYAITADCEAETTYPIAEFSGIMQKPIDVNRLGELVKPLNEST